MGDSSTGLHEQAGALTPATIDRHRAIVSLMEELEAVDWYDQRVEAATDPELAALLAHNRDEEKEHAAMTLEWLRRRDPALDTQLRTYLFTSVPVTEVEEAAMSEDGPDGDAEARAGDPPDGSLGIGSLRGVSE
ncbi:hypothetical protein UG55_102288 [Frankia sp. EI5c]|uniref:encapsulin-associated ferritin-like protein n=1 Tax=Frankia sp. EI5c TaxID=683316 RepID=UPI0007C2FABF|nr:ferritin-like domain-containing protein [Frankia sp. EI5c]OAA25428.1 hypothetical protein UG55_102288 [Frankia sp. EI5c]